MPLRIGIIPRGGPRAGDGGAGSVSGAGGDGTEGDFAPHAGDLALALEEDEERLEVEEVAVAVSEDGLRAERSRRGGSQLEHGTAPTACGDEGQDVVAGDDGRGDGLGGCHAVRLGRSTRGAYDGRHTRLHAARAAT